MSEKNTNIMPHNIEAEQVVLGCIIFDNSVLSEISSKIKINDLYLAQHQRIYEAMISISNRAEPIDLVTLKNELGMDFETAGGIEYLTQLRFMVSTTANLKYHIKIIKDNALRRSLINGSSKIIEDSYNIDNDVEKVLSLAEMSILDIAQGKEMTDIFHIKDILKTNLAALSELIKNKGATTGIPTGFSELDKRTSGLHPTDLILIAARPSMGKTSFAINIATNAAMRGNAAVAIFSLEMGKEQLANRI